MKKHFWVNCGSVMDPAARCKIDPEDAERVLLYKWSFAHGSDGRNYVRGIDRSTKPPKQIKMHRYLLDAPEGMQVDHINGDPLDNRRENLRLATPAQNQANRRKRSGGSSVYKGVSWHKKGRAWRATINLDRKQIHLGFFKDQTEAAKAYDAKAKELFGEFAYLNLKQGQPA